MEHEIITALIFDVDGTLAETEEAHRKAFNDTFAEAGLDWRWSIQEYTDLLKTTGGRERMREYRNRLRRTAPSDDEIARLHKIKTSRYGDILASGKFPAARPGITELVKRAQRSGLRLAVATTTNKPNVDSLCKAIWQKDAANIFEVIAAGDEVEAKKPAADIYNLALERLALPPQRTLAFEDSRNGVESAKKAGVRVIASPSVYTAGDDLSAADWLVQSFEQKHLSPEPWSTIFPD